MSEDASGGLVEQEARLAEARANAIDSREGPAMGLTDLPRTAVRTCLKAARIPLDLGLRALGHRSGGTVAVAAADRVDATAREGAELRSAVAARETEAAERAERRRTQAAKAREAARQKAAQAETQPKPAARRATRKAE